MCEFSGQVGLPVSEEHRRQALRWLHQYWAQSSELLADQETYGETWISLTNRCLAPARLRLPAW
jgi:hypothetical protein